MASHSAPATSRGGAPSSHEARPVAPSAAWGGHLDARHAGILAATNAFTVQQHVKLDELGTQCCFGSTINQPTK